MEKKASTDKKGDYSQKVESNKVSIDLSKLYSYNHDEAEVCIDNTIYANLSYVQLSHRDVYIDFLKMPGIIENKKQIIYGTRVYLTHSAAQQLAVVLSTLLKQIHEAGEMEFYQPGLEETVKIKKK